MIDWRAIGYRVLVKVDEVSNEIETDGGFKLYKPDTVVDQEQGGIDRGVVVDIGPCAFRDEGGVAMWCDIGDYIIWPRYAGRAVRDDDGTLYHVLNDKDVLLKKHKE